MAVEVITRASAPRTTAGIFNIPFVQKDANATSLKATFWIETVRQKNESTFLQLQYTQTVILNFPRDRLAAVGIEIRRIDWA